MLIKMLNLKLQCADNTKGFNTFYSHNYFIVRLFFYTLDYTSSLIVGGLDKKNKNKKIKNCQKW